MFKIGDEVIYYPKNYKPGKINFLIHGQKYIIKKVSKTEFQADVIMVEDICLYFYASEFISVSELRDSKLQNIIKIINE